MLSFEMIEAITISPYTDKNKGWKHTRVSYPSDLMTISSRQVKAFLCMFLLILNLVTMKLSYLSSSISLAVSALTSVVYGYLTFNLGMMTNTAFSPHCVSEYESQI